MRNKTPKTHQSLYMPTPMFEELMAEAKRQDRSRSYMLQLAWQVARDRIKAMPSPL